MRYSVYNSGLKKAQFFNLVDAMGWARMMARPGFMYVVHDDNANKLVQRFGGGSEFKNCPGVS